MSADSPQPLKFGPRTWLRVYAGVIRQAGLRVALRSIRIQLEEKITGYGLASTLRLTRIWYLLGTIAGVALVCWSPQPRATEGQVDIASLIAFASVVGAGLAIALRSLAMLASTYSSNLLIHRFSVSLVPTLLRAAALAAIAFVAAQFQWPLSAGTAIALLLVGWLVWPLFLRMVIAFQAPRHITHRLLPVDQLLAMAARKLPAQARRQVAIHEAGHAVFFGLGNTVPEDLFAWMDDELPELSEVVEGDRRAALAVGAVSSFNSLTEKVLTLDLHRREMLVLLGMLCGGGAAEAVFYGAPSAGMIGDAALFEGRARQFLSLFPDQRWPYFIHAVDEEERKVNAASLAGFRAHLLDQAMEFVRTNKPVVEAVAKALQEKGELDVEDLRHLLPGVKASAGFERFDWPADMPAMHYPGTKQAASPTLRS
jgi:hypothetical protein